MLDTGRSIIGGLDIFYGFDENNDINLYQLLRCVQMDNLPIRSMEHSNNECRIVPKTNKTKNLQYIINLGQT